MPTAEYKVYVSDAALIAEIEEYCAENNLTESQAFRECMEAKLQNEA